MLKRTVRHAAVSAAAPSRRNSEQSRHDARPSSERERATDGRLRWGAPAILAAIIGVAVVLHLWGIRRDLPFDNDIDESPFVLAAVNIAATRTLNPGWFGHPGSTLIYPLAGVYHLWDRIDRQGFLNGTSEFYMLGRYVSVAYALLGLPLVFLLGRRAFAEPPASAAAPVAVALIGAWFTLLSPLLVAEAQITRTDSACIFFTTLTLWLCLRLLEQATIRRAVLAGAAVGLAVSTKYLLAALLPVFLTVLVAAVRREPRRKPWACLAVGVLAVPVAFAASSPYVFLDATTALANLRTEARTTHPGADGLPPVQNLIWYITAVIPGHLGRPRTLLMLVGMGAALRRRRVPALVLMAWMLVYLIAISVHPLHWERWIIPLLPVCMLFAAMGLWSVVVELGARLRLPAVVQAAALLLAVAGISYAPGRTVITTDRLHAQPTTEILAREWVIQHLPPGSRIAQEWFTAPLHKAGFDIGRQFSLATHSVEDYARSGYRYVMVSSAIYATYFNEPARYATEIAFYQHLAATARLLQEVAPSPTRAGPTVRIYELPTASP